MVTLYIFKRCCLASSITATDQSCFVMSLGEKKSGKIFTQVMLSFKDVFNIVKGLLEPKPYSPKINQTGTGNCKDTKYEKSS